MAFWRRKKREPEVEVSRTLEVESVDDVETPTYDTTWEMGESDEKLTNSLIAEMQRTGAVTRKQKHHPQKPKRQSVKEIGDMLRETAEGLNAEDNRDNDYYSDPEAHEEMLKRQSEIGETVFDNPIFEGGETDDPYLHEREGYTPEPLDEEDYYRYGPGGATHGRMI